MSIKILIADDHGVIRAGLKALLAGFPQIEVVGEAANGREVLAKVSELQPDIILMDLSMPEMGGVETTRQLRKVAPSVRVLILTVHEDEGLLKEVIQSGAGGYIIKRAGEDELLHAIQVVARKDIYVHPSLTRFLLQDISPAEENQPQVKPEELTERELEILRLLAKGYTNRQIAEQLILSQRTVEGHRSNLTGKLGLHSRVDLINYAEEHGLLGSDRK